MFEFIVISLGLVALLIDFFTSSLLMPRVRIFGQLSEPYDWEKTATRLDSRSNADGDFLRVYQCAIQNCEPRELEWIQPGMDLELGICGPGRFLSPNLMVFAGREELKAQWLEKGKTMRISIASMRPYKLWVLRCLVDGRTDEMQMTIKVPTKYPVRKFLMELSTHIFQFPVMIDEKRIVFRTHEDRALSRGFRTQGHWVGIRLVAYSVVGALFYSGLCDSFGPSALGIASYFKMNTWEPYLCGGAIYLIALGLHRLSLRELPSSAQSYQIPREVEIEPMTPAAGEHS